MEQVRHGAVAAEWRAPFALAPAGRLSVGRAAAAFSVYAVAFYFAFRYGMSFSQVTASPFWFPDSILLCALLLSPMRWWWVFVLGALPIRLAVGGPDVPVEFALTTFVDRLGQVCALGRRTSLSACRSVALAHGARLRAVLSRRSPAWFPPWGLSPVRARVRHWGTTTGYPGSSGFSATWSRTSS